MINNFCGTINDYTEVQKLAIELLKETIKTGTVIDGKICEGMLAAAEIIVRRGFATSGNITIMPERFNSISEPK